MKIFDRSRLAFARLFSLALTAAALSTVGCTGLSAMGGVASVPPLVVRPGCSLWTGTISGNDPMAHIELELCRVEPGSPEVMGRAQLTSPRSGWSVREVEGAFDEDGTLELHDYQFDVYAPDFGWIFCLIDEYELKQSGARGMEGDELAFAEPNGLHRAGALSRGEPWTPSWRRGSAFQGPRRCFGLDTRAAPVVRCAIEDGAPASGAVSPISVLPSPPR